jgi:hypothetical protein
VVGGFSELEVSTGQWHPKQSWLKWGTLRLAGL